MCWLSREECGRETRWGHGTRCPRPVTAPGAQLTAAPPSPSSPVSGAGMHPTTRVAAFRRVLENIVYSSFTAPLIPCENRAFHPGSDRPIKVRPTTANSGDHHTTALGEDKTLKNSGDHHPTALKEEDKTLKKKDILKERTKNNFW